MIAAPLAPYSGGEDTLEFPFEEFFPFLFECCLLALFCSFRDWLPALCDICYILLYFPCILSKYFEIYIKMTKLLIYGNQDKIYF